MTNELLNTPTQSLQLRAGLHPLTVLQLLQPHLFTFREQLREKIEQAPKFFENAPIVIDLSALATLEKSQPLDFVSIKTILHQHRLIPVGVKHGNPTQHAAALQAGFAILQDNAKTAKTDLHSTVAKNPFNASNMAKTAKVVSTEVRSGQQIYAKGADLIVLGPISHGAELIADGHIHVYHVLRGRALAGVNGNKEAHIFCHRMEAELLSIAGQYKVSDDIEKTIWRAPVDVSLVNGQLNFRLLS